MEKSKFLTLIVNGNVIHSHNKRESDLLQIEYNLLTDARECYKKGCKYVSGLYIKDFNGFLSCAYFLGLTDEPIRALNLHDFIEGNYTIILG